MNAQNPQSTLPGDSFKEQWKAQSVPMVLPYAAHAAPMQLLFHTGASFPAEYRGDALVTMRGSWNRGTVRAGGLAEGKPTTLKPFVSGFVSADGKAHFARPMSLAQIADGALLMADDANGVVYRFAYVAPSERGGAKIDKKRLIGQRWGKHFLIELCGFSVRIHFLMFGRYCINERKDGEPRLSLAFSRGRELNFYGCAVRYIEGALDDEYDWRTDVMSDTWDAAAARRKLRRKPNELICDALLDQSMFAGVGNIIKNEVLFRVGVHPQSKVGALPAETLRALVDQARQYSFEFLEWKKAFVLRQHWLVHNKGICPRCNGRLTRKYLGTRDRRTFFCERCQKRFRSSKAASRKRARGPARRAGLKKSGRPS